MSAFPLFIDIAGKTGLIVGGGKVALRKAEKLLEFGCQLCVVAPEVLPEFQNRPEIAVALRPFTPEDLDCNPVLVIAATGDREVNRLVGQLAKERGIPVNVADSEEECSFYFPSCIQRGSLKVGLTTGGDCPSASGYYRQQIENLLPDTLPELLDYLKDKRDELKSALPKGQERTDTIRSVSEAALKKGAPLTEAEEAAAREGRTLGSVYLVGAGCGSADLITVRGLRLIQSCDVLVYDELIDKALLDAAPKHAERVSMGKRAGKHSAKQEEIIAELIRQAKLGRKVVRLKGGDPYLFGRGGEELFALQDAGIPCEEVPGIPSAIGIPAQYGIPVTHRRVSRSLHIVTAHTADTADGLPKDMHLYAQMEGTLVFLMGLGKLAAIAESLIANGKSPDTPAAVLSGGNAPHPVCIRGTLATLPELAAKAEAPAIIVVGDVTALGV